MKTNTKTEQSRQAGLSQKPRESGRAGNGASPAQSSKMNEERRRDARAAAEQIGGTRAYVAKNAKLIETVLNAFGGRVLAVVTE